MSDNAEKAHYTVTKKDFGFVELLNMTSEELRNLWSVISDRSDIYSMVCKGIVIGLILGALGKLVSRLLSEKDNQRPHQE